MQNQVHLKYFAYKLSCFASFNWPIRLCCTSANPLVIWNFVPLTLEDLAPTFYLILTSLIQKYDFSNPCFIVR